MEAPGIWRSNAFLTKVLIWLLIAAVEGFPLGEGTAGWLPNGMEKRFEGIWLATNLPYEARNRRLSVPLPYLRLDSTALPVRSRDTESGHPGFPAAVAAAD